MSPPTVRVRNPVLQERVTPLFYSRPRRRGAALACPKARYTPHTPLRATPQPKTKGPRARIEVI